MYSSFPHFEWFIIFFKIYFNSKSESVARAELLEKAKTVPHLTNINMDPSLSGTIKLLLEGDEIKKTIGVPKKADIGLYGIGYASSVYHF